MKKLFFSLVLIFFVFIGSVRVYGFYEDTKITQLTDVNTHEILTQNLVTDSNKNLVPKGSILGVDDVEEVVFEYQVFVQKNLEIDFLAENLTINGEEINEDLLSLFNFDFEQVILQDESIQTGLLDGREDGYFTKITLTVSMNNPTYNEYKLLAGQAINFDVLFKVI